MKEPCQDLEPELSAFLDGELPPVEHQAVEAHLSRCAACRTTVGRLRRVGVALRRWDARETHHVATPAFRNRVVERLGLTEAERAQTTGRRRLVTAYAAAAASALVALGAGAALLGHRVAAGQRPGYDALSVEVAQLSRLAERARATGSASGAAAPEPGGPSVERLAPLPRVVPGVEDLAEPEAPAPDAPGRWVEYDGGLLHREARDALDRQQQDRRNLAMEERLARLARERQAAAAAVERPTTDQPAAARTRLGGFLDSIRVSEAEHPAYHDVQVWPLELRRVPFRRAAYMTAGEALQTGVLHVTEESDDRVLAENRDKLDRPVLLLAGDVLVGKREDRVARDDALIRVGEQVVLRTFTTGRGRRGSRSVFHKAVRSSLLAPAHLRALVAADAQSLVPGLDQDTFDVAVAGKLTSLATHGQRGGRDNSLDNLSANEAMMGEVARYVQAFRPRLEQRGVVGYAVAAGPELLGVEIFGDESTFRDLLDRTLSSYVLEALASEGPRGGRVDRERVEGLLAVARAGGLVEQDSTGLIRGLDARTFGSALVAGGEVVHAVLFPSVPPLPAETAARKGRDGVQGGGPSGSGDVGTGPGRGSSSGGGGLRDE